jgi:hypothetical protein
MTTLLDQPARSADNPAILSAIRDPGCNLAIWQRRAFADFTPLTAGNPNDLRFTSDPAGLSGTLADALAANGFAGDAALHGALAEDAAQLARLFCDAMELATFELRLEVVRTDSCRKFHADYVTARLITTYVGEGTHWLDESDADRVVAGAEPQRIHRLAPFDVGLFKGRLSAERPAIHRSPPIAGTEGGARLLLVLNPASRSFAQSRQSPLPPPVHLP